MSVHVVLSLKEIKNKLFLFIFFSLFNFVNILIFIGELTQKILFYPAKAFVFIVRKTKTLSIFHNDNYKSTNATKLHEEKRIDIDLDEVEDFDIDIVDVTPVQDFAEYCVYIRIPKYKLLPLPRELTIQSNIHFVKET
jgi:hypothetical protein